MRSEIIFIGPVGAGKTTLGTLVAEALQLPKHSLDDLRWGYYDEIGYDVATMKASDAKEGFAGVYQYWKPFEIHAVERMLEEHKDCVFDFGAGHSVYANDGLLRESRTGARTVLQCCIDTTESRSRRIFVSAAESSTQPAASEGTSGPPREAAAASGDAPFQSRPGKTRGLHARQESGAVPGRIAGSGLGDLDRAPV